MDTIPAVPACRPPVQVTMLRPPVTIRSAGALLWVTVEGDVRDYFVESGETLQVRARGRVAVEAIEPGEWTVEQCPDRWGLRHALRAFGALLGRLQPSPRVPDQSSPIASAKRRPIASARP